MRNICGVLLAAGESRRMGFPKALLRIGNETYLQHLAATMLTSVDHLVIVLGAHIERIRLTVPQDTRLTVAENRNYRRGQLSSLKVALRQVGDVSAVMMHLIDHPRVKRETFRAVVEQYEHTGKPIVIARYNGRRGHPVLFDRSLFGELLAAPEDQGARVVVNADPSRIAYCDVDDEGIVQDLDTPADVVRAGLAEPQTKA
ncbi:MAG TPA: nucleotidyltransferase family protein [Candidatus Binataceae bacterium]|nr:nucleotidyltransferase family protein [Candidatus Binataceae bacterium]